VAEVASDLFYWQGATFLLVADYFSRLVKYAPLKTDTSATEVIKGLKEIFTRHGIPDELISDNTPQCSAYAFHEYSWSYGFRHATSSSKFPQSSESESAVHTIKNLLGKANGYMYSALPAYGATSLQ